ncbi:HEAT repeat domain-containing protein [Methanospirillum sp. J.3.6.1-F.2.7.3]|uniref:HEAT repeat domain-containing protein n=1 Tax=Methanospirillum purgamenti TaxID=2834276 RepID=A0A8E7B2A7_9EURY|nr:MULTISPECIES: HEAT repeat domain-containing protein [Methanospirillum]MDX8551866.1 HEAT repeat domain-containing protein [Methanospirillum hungatei]QVV89178.1 HEAT repeat domain-containing protein [Methanospirillum sp. J.3.6.1-F.2.7.3]
MTVLDKILTYIHMHRGYIEPGKILFIAFLALISLFVSVYVLWESPWTGFRFIYVFIPHLYLIPIILLALWYPKSGLRLVGIILFSVVLFGIFAEVFGYQFSIAFVMLYTGLDLATITVLLLYVKDRRLVEAVLTDLIERGEKKKEKDISKFGGDFDNIINALGSSDEHDREEAVNALSEISDPRVVLPLIRAMSDDSPFVRRDAAEALGKTGALKAVHPLMKALADDDRCVRETSAEALGHLGDIAIPDIIQNLNDNNWKIRLGSIVALRVSSGSVPSLDPILKCLSDESPFVRREAVKTLGRIGDRTIIPYLIQALKDSDSGVRLRGVRGLVKLGEPEEIIPVLIRYSQDPDGAVRVLAREYLNILQGDQKI